MFFLSLGSLPLFAYEAIEVSQGGTIRGTVRWKGAEIPESTVLKIVKNADFCGDTFTDDVLTIHPENQGMQNVVVFLENIEKGRSS